MSTELVGCLDWPGAQQLFRIQRPVVRLRSGAVLHDATVAGVTRLAAGRGPAARLLGAVRGQWTIKHRSHWVRDVTFAQDRCQVRTPNIAQVLALLRPLAERPVAAARRTCRADPSVARRLRGAPSEN